MLIFAFVMMFAGLGALAIWLHLFISGKEGKRDYFKKRYSNEEYRDFIFKLSIISSVIVTISGLYVWYITPLFWYLFYRLYRYFAPPVTLESE